jgi:hypothetical protein
MSDQPSTEVAVQWAAFAIAVAICVGAFFMLFFAWLGSRGAEWRSKLLENHFPAVIGLPVAAAGAFIIVTLFRQAAGPIKIRGWGLDIEGAGGPVLLWVVCFIAISVAIWMTWNLKS